ncbi:hypothetical protein CLOSTMETH_03181 [[Clostridium] methylpentosum DSM 5476]|uniref:Uncharacterized protein n=1 Tax=[Clostridium] methylpentosum DSM 5476 TaxID=537013 RepID=C0EHE4_9FIRM|nr:hypothetical protein CLOSTMETH_03181 [[Clostridium] methylpentosum DSM 5476]
MDSASLDAVNWAAMCSENQDYKAGRNARLYGTQKGGADAVCASFLRRWRGQGCLFLAQLKTG